MCSKCVFRYLYFSYCSSAALYSCSSQSSLCLAPPIHLLYQEQFTPSALPRWLKQTINKHTHGMGGVIIVSNSVFKVFPSNRLEGTWSPVYWQLSRSRNKSQRKLANRYVYIALHSLHTVRHDNIHITIRIVNWLTLFARAASPKTWRFDVDELEEPTCMVYAWNALCS